MNKLKKLITYISILILTLSSFMLVACNNTDDQEKDPMYQFYKTVDNDNTKHIDDVVEPAFYNTKVKITFSGKSYTSSYKGNAVSFHDDGNGNLTFYAKTNKLCFEFSGTLNGSITIYTENKVMITFDGASVTSKGRPAFNIVSSKRTFVVLKGENTFTDSEDYDDDAKARIAEGLTGAGVTLDKSIDIKGAFFSEAQLNFSGDGVLNIVGKNQGALSVDGYIRFFGGTFNITSENNLAIHANEYIIIDAGEIIIDKSYGGIEMREGCFVMNGGKLTIDAEFTNGVLAGTGAQSGKILLNNGNNSYNYGDIEINNGIIDVKNAVEGLEAKNNMTINGGYFTLITQDDPINVEAAIVINDGYFYLNGSDDAIDANLDGDAIIINGGTIIAIGVAESIEATFGNTIINGGIVLGFSDFVKKPADSGSQHIVIMKGAKKDTAMSIVSESETIISFVVPTDCNTIFLSTSNFKTDSSYDIVAGGEITGGENFFALYTDAQYNGGEIIKSFSLTQKLLVIGGTIY